MREKRQEQWWGRFWRWVEEILGRKNADTIVVGTAKAMGVLNSRLESSSCVKSFHNPHRRHLWLPWEGERGESWGKNINYQSVRGLTWIYNELGKHPLSIPGTHRKSPAPSVLIICCHRPGLLSGDLFDLRSFFSHRFHLACPKAHLILTPRSECTCMSLLRDAKIWAQSWTNSAGRHWLLQLIIWGCNSENCLLSATNQLSFVFKWLRTW